MLAGGCAIVISLGFLGVHSVARAQAEGDSQQQNIRANTELKNARKMILEGRHTFRFDTFGSEDFWGDQVKLHQAIEGEKLGGIGPGVSPKQALALGLKVDLNAVPKAMGAVIKKGGKALDDPAVTVALLKANAVVGVTGFFDQNDNKHLKSVGIQCALCHSTVDDALVPAGRDVPDLVHVAVTSSTPSNNSGARPFSRRTCRALSRIRCRPSDGTS